MISCKVFLEKVLQVIFPLQENGRGLSVCFMRKLEKGMRISMMNVTSGYDPLRIICSSSSNKL
jgi:hypothetical protein